MDFDLLEKYAIKAFEDEELYKEKNNTENNFIEIILNSNYLNEHAKKRFKKNLLKNI